MKIKNLLFAVITMGLLGTSCEKDNYITPNGNVTTISKTLSGYNELEVSDQFTVYITFSDTIESIEVEANANLHAHINVFRLNDRLIINLDNEVNITNGNAVLNIYITTKELDAFYGVGAASIELQNTLTVNNLEIELTGASNFNGTVAVDQLNSKLTGASNLSLTGSSNSFEIDAKGGSNLKEFDFETNFLFADLEGGCNLYLTVQSELDVNANGASNVYYKGNGVIIQQHLSGGSQIVKMD